MIYLCYIVFVLSVLAQTNASGHCVMRGECDLDDLTFLNKPCVYSGSPQPLSDSDSIAIIKNLCPSMKTDDDFSVCCSAEQVSVLNIQLDILSSLFKRCPSCYHNLANLFCHLVCSPSQSSFLEVTAIGKNNSVDELKYYITEEFTTGLFDSCKNVKLSFTTGTAMSICCGVHSTDCNPHLWLEYMGSHDPSPYQVDFHFETSSSVNANDNTFYPMNATIIPCSEAVSSSGSPCSCVDCPCKR